jgi:hypothetical protein
VPLPQWNLYKNAIMASESFLNQEDSLTIVDEVFHKMSLLERIEKMTPDMRTFYGEQWDIEFENLNKKVIL